MGRVPLRYTRKKYFFDKTQNAPREAYVVRRDLIASWRVSRSVFFSPPLSSEGRRKPMWPGGESCGSRVRDLVRVHLTLDPGRFRWRLRIFLEAGDTQ
jgi:hypothetical protein